MSSIQCLLYKNNKIPPLLVTFNVKQGYIFWNESNGETVLSTQDCRSFKDIF